MPNTPRDFCWYELMTPDAAAAKTFYGKVIGWTAEDVGHPDMPYAVFKVPEGQIAGLLTLTPDMKAGGAMPGWMGYIDVEDVDAYAARVTEAGGVVHRTPADIPEVGRFAVMADPQGAPFVLFKNLPTYAPPPKGGFGQAGYFGWHELVSTDPEAAFSFYSKLFGWTKAEAYDMGEMGAYQLFAAGGDPIGGIMAKPEGAPGPFWMYYIRVDAISAAVKRIEAAGGTIANPPMEVPGGAWIVQAIDPQGAMFALMSVNA